jgi:hypothetical protein
MLTQWSFRGCSVLVSAVLPVKGMIALWAQALKGTISGTVTDSSAAGSTVEVKNTATPVTRTLTMNAQGRFSVPQLIVDNYGRDVFGVA